MEFEIKNKNDITCTIAKVEFPTFEVYLKEAQDIADYVSSMEVTEENLKSVKETLADARKVTDRLNRVRIDTRSYILTEYESFAQQIKDLTDVVSSAEAEVRKKVKELDDKEREEKKRALYLIWNDRLITYPETSGFLGKDGFEKWLKPQHLNKSKSLKSSEKEMVEWLEKTENDILAADALGEEYLTEYLTTLDFSKSVANVDRNHEIMRKIREVQDDDEDREEIATFIVSGKKDILLVETLLKANEISYERK